MKDEQMNEQIITIMAHAIQNVRVEMPNIAPGITTDRHVLSTEQSKLLAWAVVEDLKAAGYKIVQEEH
jgi:hypothetical protein